MYVYFFSLPGWRQILIYNWEMSQQWTWPDWRWVKMVQVLEVFNLLWPRDFICQHWTESALALVMACCLMAPSQYLNQCWFFIKCIGVGFLITCLWKYLWKKNVIPYFLQSLNAPKLSVGTFILVLNLADSLPLMLPRCLLNLKVMEKLETCISYRQDLAKSCDKICYAMLKWCCVLSSREEYKPTWSPQSLAPVSMWCILTPAETKWLPFSRRHFQMDFCVWKCMNFD